jgi:hypothetical protein
MPTLVDEKLTIFDFDSAALAGTASVLHALREAGEWTATVFREQGRPLASTEIRVRDDAVTWLASVDLSTVEQAGRARWAGEPVNSQVVRTGGYLQLQASQLPGGFFVTLARSGPASDRVVGTQHEISWDSRSLTPNDLFVCLPLRPGRYVLANTLAQSQCALVVRYPDPRAVDRSRPPRPEPVRIRVAESFAPATVTLTPGQGLVLEAVVRARLTLTLETRDDGPPELAAWRAAHDAEAWRAFNARLQAKRTAAEAARNK